MKLIRVNKSGLKSLLLGTLFYFILIDSGGATGIRNITISLFFIIGFLSMFFIKYHLSNKILLIFLSILFSIFYAIFIGIINNIYYIKVITLLFFLLFIIIVFYTFILFSKQVIINALIFGGYLFSTGIFIVHFMIFIEIVPVEILLIGLNILNGYFHPFGILGFEYYSIYFQATLTLVPLAITAYLYNKKMAFYIFLFALAISLSRFGIITILLFVFFVNMFGEKKLSYAISKYFLFFILSFTLFYFYTYLFNYENYISTNTSANVRIGHLISLVDSFSFNNFLFGQGGGSYFYTIGRDMYVDNVELTQLELIRKYGIIFFIIFHLIINSLFLLLYRIKEYSFIIIIFSFYFVSLSNPVLTSLTFSIFFGFGIAELSKINKKDLNAQ